MKYHQEPYEVLRARIHEEQRRHREEHKEWLDEYQRKYRAENREKFIESRRRYRHSEKGIQTAKKYYARPDVQERILAYRKTYQKRMKK